MPGKNNGEKNVGRSTKAGLQVRSVPLNVLASP